MTLNEYISNCRDSRYITTDSRSVFDPENTIFAAIRTDVGDGHRYIDELYNRGVRTFIVEKMPEAAAPDAVYIVADNVPQALADIARARICGNENGVIITGSVGKTTMKELLYTALLQHEDVRRSPRSWNSSIGVPLAVCDMTRTGHHAAHYLTEAGIDAPGQAEFLNSTLAGSHRMAIVTPITDEHDEAFASHADKIREKMRVIAGASIIVYATSDPELKAQLEARKAAEPGLKLFPVEQGGFPSIYHALADKAMEVIGYDAEARKDIPTIELVNKRREISSGSFGNIIYRDYFTPDLRSLQDALDFMRRHATPQLRRALFIGKLIDNATEADARRLAEHFGIDRVEAVSDDLLARIHRGEEFRDMQILLFGRHDATFGRVAEALESAGHDTTLEVDLDAITHNYNYYRSLVPAGTGIVAMVKASAYGMGAVEIGKTMQSLGAAYLAVAVIEEGIALREAGITMPVMVLNPVTNRYPALFAHKLEPAVFSIEELDLLITEAEAYGARNYPVHIKLDTGMHRVGFTEAQLAAVAPRLEGVDAVRVASVFSHLATADCLDLDSYTHSQLDAFKTMTDSLRAALGYPFRRHILNTAGMMRFADSCDYEMARLGIGLYGVSPYEGPEAANLRPVAAFRTHIISLKHWPAGTSIGYGCNGHTVADDSIIATVPVGYADGLNRRLGRGHTSVVVRGVECPTIGNICMDLCMIDVSGVPNVAVGDSVEIFGPAMPVERLAAELGTIPYEVLTWVSPRVKRTYFRR